MGRLALAGTGVADTAGRWAVVGIDGYLMVGRFLVLSVGFLTFSGNRIVYPGLGDICSPLIVGCALFGAALGAGLIGQARWY